jgi:hypothetical protein
MTDTSGELSPLSLLNCKEKDDDENDVELDRLLRLSRSLKNI